MNHDNFNDPVQRVSRNNNVLLFLIVSVAIFLWLFSIYNSNDMKGLNSDTGKQQKLIARQESNQQKQPSIGPKPTVTEVKQSPSISPVPSIANQTSSTSNDLPGKGLTNGILISPGIVNLSIGSHGFSPVNFKGSATSDSLNIKLTKKKYNGINAEPDYSGMVQWYGYMDLGNRHNRRFYLVLDLQRDETFVMYFDKNKNGNLTDDGKPLLNKGSGDGGPGGFARQLSIPWPILIENSPFEGDFNIWFFSNKSGWGRGNRVSHYSQTQLEGRLSIAGNEYMVLLVDKGYNDADLTNDGVRIDLNGNDKIDRDERASNTHEINGQNYTFDVMW